MSKSNCYGAMLWAFSTLLVSMGCSDDSNDFKDVDGQVPSVSLTTTHVQTEAGREFTIKGTVEDKDGIRSIRLQNSDLELDKTIDLVTLYEELLYTYELSYKFTAPAGADETDSFSILITVTDVGGRTTTSTLVLTMDGDLTNPVFSSAPDTKTYILTEEDEEGETTASYTLDFTVTDNKGFDAVYISIVNTEDGSEYYSEKVTTFTDLSKTLEYNRPIPFPADTLTYTLEIRAVDKFENETVRTSQLIVRNVFDFDYMYLADVTTAAKLNSDVYGVPMLIDHTGEYEYTAYYYCETAGTGIRFIPQKTAFTPICFGLDPSNSAVMIRSTNADPIVLEAVGYYEINFNIQTGAYTVATYTPTDEPVKIGSDVYLDSSRPGEGTMKLQLCLAGTGFPDYESWSTSNGVPLTLSSTNPYLFSAEVRLVAGETVEFTISARHDWGWWPEPYWRFSGDENTAWDKNVKNGGSNPKITVTTSGKYMFKFDTHLLRSKLYPIN